MANAIYWETKDYRAIISNSTAWQCLIKGNWMKVKRGNIANKHHKMQTTPKIFAIIFKSWLIFPIYVISTNPPFLFCLFHALKVGMLQL